MRTFTQEQIENGFLNWTRDQRKNPQNYLTEKECKELPTEQLALANCKELLNHI